VGQNGAFWELTVTHIHGDTES